ncbi:MAG: DUF885 family protein [Gammaproteobacteria bacterium]
MKPFFQSSLALCALFLAVLSASADRAETSYATLIALYDDFLTWQDAERARRAVPNRDIAGAAATLHPDFGAAAIAQRIDRISKYQDQLVAIDTTGWARPRQVDYLAVRSRLDQHEFYLTVSKPWSRDPGFYVDRMLRITFATLPLAPEPLSALRTELAAVALLAQQAKENLNDVAADYADLALHNLSNADGVGHGFAYRAVPPPGVLGWYDDLLARARETQSELVPNVSAARDAVQSFYDWLSDNRPAMTGKAGVGEAYFNWYLKHVKLMPYDTDQIVTLGLRELDRLWSLYALEQHRNRDLPTLKMASNAADYAERIARADTTIRAFLADQDIITIPEYVGTLATNVPWIERKNGPNFWEQVQYRDPTPDHLHAVIPGHRFDGLLERHNDHPIRGRLTSGARAEGWAVYLEEAMLHAGLDVAPRVRELIYVFGIFRAARVPADVWLQLNTRSVSDVVQWWMERTPYLDEDVARVDAEIYLRRPPGYGLGYTVGMLQMQTLLADLRRQRGDDFVLQEFHDQFMATGRLPISLIRWEMTGLRDEIDALGPRQRLQQVKAFFETP